MFQTITLFLLMLVIILFPIPLKLTLKYSNKLLGIYFYHRKLSVKKPKIKDVKNDLKTKPKENFLKSLLISDIKSIINDAKNLKFKPTITLNTKIEYGLDDAALVAILYGLLHTCYSSLYILLLNFVKVKNMNFDVIPYFAKNNLNIKITCIIYTNLAKIIYIAYRLLIRLINIKRSKTNIKKFKGGNIHG